MASLNHWEIIGNLGRDPELRFTPSGVAVCEFSVACSERWNDRNGQAQERTEWVRVTAWNKTAEAVGNYLAKGSKVYVSGRAQTDEYEKDGVKRWSTKLVANKVLFLDSKGGGGQGNAPAPANTGQSAAAAVDPDDLPFE